MPVSFFLKFKTSSRSHLIFTTAQGVIFETRFQTMGPSLPGENPTLWL